MFKNQNKLTNVFCFKDRIPKGLTTSVAHKFQRGLRIGEHIKISPLTKKTVKPNSSVVSDHLLLCNHSLSFESFSVLTNENRNLVSELKESLLIMRDKPSLNRNILSAPFYLFDREWERVYLTLPPHIFFVQVESVRLCDG